MSTQSNVIATNQPTVSVPGWLSESITAFDSAYSGALIAGEQIAKSSPVGRVIRLVDLASGTVHAAASNGGFNDRAYASAASSYLGGALDSFVGSFAGPVGAVLGAIAGFNFGTKFGEWAYDNHGDDIAGLTDHLSPSAAPGR